MTNRQDDYRFEAEYGPQSDWQTKSRRFMRYLASRNVECWGFFIAGLIFGGMFL